MKVLVAEDHAPSRRLLEAILGSLEHEVTLAEDGAEAWRRFEAGRFAVVISDWTMPKLEGIELTRRIRALKDRPYTYVILVTARTGKADYREAMAAGVDDFLSKPFDGDYLESRIRVGERISGLQQEVRQLEGLLPVCSYCKKIRDERDQWVAIERYISARTAAEFSHGICPTCLVTRVEPEFGLLGS